jgi:uncharacterized protein
MTALTEDMKRLIREQKLGFYATTCPDGTPNLSPKGTTAVWDEDHIFFADIRSPHTVTNVRGGSGIEVNVVDPFARKGYRFKGSATVHDPGAPLYVEGIERLQRAGFKTSPERIRSIVVIKVERAKPLISPAYDDDTGEGAIRQSWIDYFHNLNEAEQPAKPSGVAADA